MNSLRKVFISARAHIFVQGFKLHPIVHWQSASASDPEPRCCHFSAPFSLVPVPRSGRPCTVHWRSALALHRTLSAPPTCVLSSYDPSAVVLPFTHSIRCTRLFGHHSSLVQPKSLYLRTACFKIQPVLHTYRIRNSRFDLAMLLFLSVWLLPPHPVHHELGCPVLDPVPSQG
jgi:hypothetical protein